MKVCGVLRPAVRRKRTSAAFQSQVAPAVSSSLLSGKPGWPVTDGLKYLQELLQVGR